MPRSAPAGAPVARLVRYAARVRVWNSSCEPHNGLIPISADDIRPEEPPWRSRSKPAPIAKVSARLVPFLIVCYFVAYLDRVNVSFAALTMNKDLGLSASAFGFGAGIFFLAYFLFEVPSNLFLERVGARKWIARIMFTLGPDLGAAPRSSAVKRASTSCACCSASPRPASSRASSST